LLKNLPHTPSIRKKPVPSLHHNFYDEPKRITDQFDGKAQNWLAWRYQDPVFRKDYVNYSSSMINTLVRKALQGIVWKYEFEPQNYDKYLILPTYHELRNRIKDNFP
jgi:hypothetical protein